MIKSIDENDGASSEWSTHNGGPMPVAPGTTVVVRYRGGSVSVVEAGKRRWLSWPEDIGTSDWDIVAWRLATEADT